MGVTRQHHPSFFSGENIEPRVVMEDITKIYPGGVVANRNIDFDVGRGEIHALLGENGAGKTTLMKILSGCLKPTVGKIIVDGREAQFRSPKEALKHKIGMVHQHFTLIPSLSVVENIMLGLERKGPILNLEKAVGEIEALVSKTGLHVDPRASVYTLSVGEKQRAEILRLLYREAEILIFDEPTSMLCGSEVDSLFNTLKQLASRGCSIVFVTHKVKEALAISDRLTVLRGGSAVATMSRSEASEEKLIELIIGRVGFPIAAPKVFAPALARDVLVINDLHVKDDRGSLAVRGASLSVREGEIFGLAGVEGNGQKELVEAIVGLRAPIKGSVHLGEAHITGSPARFIMAGGAYVPADRLGRGIALDLDLSINSSLKKLMEKDFAHRGLVNKSKMVEFAKRVVKRFEVMMPSLDTPVKFLSGGNIQKLIAGREFETVLRVLIAEQPTAGLDVRTTNRVYESLLELKGRGVGALLISTDLDEILAVSDRIGVIYNGRIVAVFSVSEATPQRIGAYMLKGEPDLESR